MAGEIEEPNPEVQPSGLGCQTLDPVRLTIVVHCSLEELFQSRDSSFGVHVVGFPAEEEDFDGLTWYSVGRTLPSEAILSERREK